MFIGSNSWPNRREGFGRINVAVRVDTEVTLDRHVTPRDALRLIGFAFVYCFNWFQLRRRSDLIRGDTLRTSFKPAAVMLTNSRAFAKLKMQCFAGVGPIQAPKYCRYYNFYRKVGDDPITQSMHIGPYNSRRLHFLLSSVSAIVAIFNPYSNSLNIKK